MIWFLKFWMVAHSGLYRLTNGRVGGKMGNMEILLLMTKGRKSGKQYTAPLTFVREGDTYLLAASGGGMPNHPGWYWNAAHGAHPVQIQVGKEVMAVEVAEADDSVRETYYDRFIKIDERYAGYKEKTDRTIPVLILTPQN